MTRRASPPRPLWAARPTGPASKARDAPEPALDAVEAEDRLLAALAPTLERQRADQEALQQRVERLEDLLARSQADLQRTQVALACACRPKPGPKTS